MTGWTSPEQEPIAGKPLQMRPPTFPGEAARAKDIHPPSPQPGAQCQCLFDAERLELRACQSWFGFSVLRSKESE